MHFLKSKLLIFFILLTITSIPGISTAVEIVRFNIQYFNNDPTPVLENHVLDVELFDDVTPLTVNNFLSYVNSGKYNESFFHRSISGFIIQAGGFTFRPITPTSILRPISEMTGLEVVENEITSPVNNEFNLTAVTNVRGTITMAKLSYNPNSATGGWFFNLTDNRANLDNQNGGFTVFGKIIDDGMTFADDIAALPIHPTAASAINPAFGTLPVTGYDITLPGAIFQENLALISSVNSGVIRPILSFTPAVNIFPLDVVDGATSTSLQVITLTNTGNETLTISSIINTSPSEFVIESENCSNVTLEPVSFIPNASCDINVRFTATAEGVITGGLALNYASSSTSYTVSMPLTAEGVSSAANLTASAVNVDFGFIDLGVTETQSLILKNKGGTDVTINSITLANNAEFTIDNNGCVVGTILSLDQSCTLVISFSHTTTSVITYDTTLTVTSDANDVSIPLRGIGVDSVIEVPASVDYSNVIIGQTDVRSVTVKNTGTGLILDTFVFTGVDADQFSFTTDCPGNGLLRKDEICLIFITFKPTSEGNKTASLAINSNDSASPAIILFSGIGTIPVAPTLNSSSSSISFPDADIITGDVFDEVLTIENIGSGTITISSISIINDNENIFSFDTAGCVVGTTLSSCDVTVSFAPVAGGIFSANLFIQTDFGDLYIPLSGIGDAPNISTSVTDIDLGTSQLNGLDVEKRFLIANIGTQNLVVSDLSITGANSSEFTREIVCTTAIPDQITLGAGKLCVIEVVLSGQSTGNKTASLVLTTNDPINPTITINLTGETDKDVDGIASNIEQIVPNGGDGNNDNVADDTQNNVASFIVDTNIAITMVSDNADLLLNSGLFVEKENEPATALLDIAVDSIPVEFPTDEVFDLGAYSFSIKVVGTKDPDTRLTFVDVAVFLPVNVYVDKYYRFGPTPGNTAPHLYDFTFDSATELGARSLGEVSIQSASGDTITRNMVIISYLDGGLGDDDLTDNGFIVNGSGGFSKGLPTESNDDSSGSMSAYYLLIMFMILPLVRLKSRNNYSS